MDERRVLGSTRDANGSVRRTITTECRVAEGHVHFAGDLHDIWTDGRVVEDLHWYRARFRASGPMLEITEIEAEPLALPFGDCQLAAQPLSQLIGVKLRGGFRRRVREALEGPHGCPHLLTLVAEMGATEVPAGYLTIRDLLDSGQATLPLFDGLIDVCRGWRRDGTAITSLRSGHGLPPRWRAEPPQSATDMSSSSDPDE